MLCHVPRMMMLTERSPWRKPSESECCRNPVVASTLPCSASVSIHPPLHRFCTVLVWCDLRQLLLSAELQTPSKIQIFSIILAPLSVLIAMRPRSRLLHAPVRLRLFFAVRQRGWDFKLCCVSATLIRPPSYAAGYISRMVFYICRFSSADGPR